MKNVLVIYFSQSGQLHEIAQNISAPLAADPNVNVTFHNIEMENSFPFPWSKESFFDAFPESFLQIPAKVKPVPQHILDIKYDLVLFHYQVWFLSPSIPINSFLKSAQAKCLLNNTPVVTVSGSRNMWFLAQEKIKVLLKQNGAHLKGNIALTDRAGNLISVITIVEWMFSGRKERHWGIFPLPGVSSKDITESSKFGEVIHDSLIHNDFNELQDNLLAKQAVRVSPYLVNVDTKGNFIFTKWSAFIAGNPDRRKTLLKIFVVYLVLAIWVISPIVYILHIIMYPFNYKKNKRIIQYYKGVQSA